ncbi:hypothetical protein B9Z55_023891 [Caenorhabditis nigoni]|uniref:Sex-determining region Y protein n=1 Tax=Caenorhabditis nigoni TaxID=1611254 RepID=A0A2G5SRU8_9PELO|nr:hypothetical protein B9Z55_023891 [Caenorhabditis nigoni]
MNTGHYVIVNAPILLLPPPDQVTTSPPLSIGFPFVMDQAAIMALVMSASDATNGRDSERSRRSSTDSDMAIPQTPIDAPSDPFDFKLVADMPDEDMVSKFMASMKSSATKRCSKREMSAVSPREERIKRPMNAFMVWSQQRRQQISAAGQKFHNSDISKMLGVEWRAMADEEKVPFVERAKQLREEHFITYPDYVYRPRRRKRIVKSTGSFDGAPSDELVDFPTNNNSLVCSMMLQQIMCCLKTMQKSGDSGANNLI